MKRESFSGESLEKALQEGKLSQRQATLNGMVKQSTKAGYISFTQSGCDTWIDLPTEMIEEAELLGQRSCRDHTHPMMRITLKEPGDPEGRILLALLAQAASTLTSKSPNMPPGVVQFQGIPPHPGFFRPPPMRESFRMNTGFAARSTGEEEPPEENGTSERPCYTVTRMVVCGSAAPGYPPPICPEYWWCCDTGLGGAYCVRM